jgi:SsrA-binding protein
MAKKSKKAAKNKKSADKSPTDQQRTISQNRRAKHRFEILEKIECGLVLYGSEVKSLRDGKVSLDEAYVRVRSGELWLVDADIPEYPQANMWNHMPKRPRKLLVHRQQLRKLVARAMEKGLTLIPLSIFFNQRGIVKIMVGVGKGKKLYDKREDIKRADVKRRIDRVMRGRR